MQEKKANWKSKAAIAAICCLCIAIGYGPVKNAFQSAMKQVAPKKPELYSPLDNPLHEKNRKILYDADNQ
ncbi:MAG: hypothetical protein JST89_13355 [Cyanobacteria bacterium SZAS-4]|nr:hypothetical protein [Cyanobacteria bacterium SZAS-4]